MIRGAVNTRYEAVVRLRVRNSGGRELDVEVLVDSGCALSLILPAVTVNILGLVRQSSGGAVLADGSVRECEVYAAEVEWDGVWRPILVSALGDEPLLGMPLIAGHRLSMDVLPGGLVEITPLPSG
jgi:predicted aspartyl protease